MRRFGLLAIYLAVSWVALCGDSTIVFAGDTEELQKIVKLKEQIQALNKAGRIPEAELVARQIVAIAETFAVKNPPILAIGLHDLSDQLYHKGKYQDSIKLQQRALAILKKSVDAQDPLMGAGTYGLATSYLAVHRYDDAEPLFKQAWAIFAKAFGDEAPQVGEVLQGLGRLSLDQRRYSDAATYLNRALAIAETAHGKRSLLLTDLLLNLAALYSAQDRDAEALVVGQRALDILETQLGPNHPRVPYALHQLAKIYMDQEQFAQAESLFRRALSIHQKSPGSNPHAEAILLVNLAHLLEIQNRNNEVESLLRRALSLEETAHGNQHPIVANTMVDLGLFYVKAGRYEEAEPLLNGALEIREAIYTKQSPEIIKVLVDLGVLHKELKHATTAEAYFKRAMKIAVDSYGEEGRGILPCLQKFAWFYAGEGRLAEAEQLISRAILISDRASGLHIARSDHYLFRSSMYWKLDRKTEALADLRQALDLAEQVRHQMSGTGTERAQSFSQFSDAFEQMVYYQTVMGDASEALQAIERSRARSLIDEMNRAGIDLNAGRPASERKAAKDLEVRLTGQVSQLEKQFEKAPEADKKKFALALAQARKELYEQYRDERNNSPVYRNLLAAGSSAPRIDQLRQTLLADDGLTLVYLFGNGGGYLIVLDSKQMRLVELKVDEPLAKRLGTSAGELTNDHLHEILMGRDNSGIVPQLATPPGNTKPETLKQMTDRLSALWELLIPEAERNALTNGQYKRLIVIPDGPLALFPLESLVVRGENDPEYLLDRGPPMIYGPSLTVLYNLSTRSKAAQASKPVLTVADPVYRQEARVASAQNSSLGELASRTRYAEIGGQLNRLPYTAEESDVVKDVFTKVGLIASSLMRESATEANVRQSVAGRKIVHLACHGLTDQAHGNFFGALALTPGKGVPIDSADDGFLTLPEIYELNMKGCELAILSACQTNYGPQQLGEGVWALSRGFLVSGARRVVASNWLVNDEAGARLIQYYCTALADDEQQSRPADYARQLQVAKKWVRSQPNWKHPYFWSTFVLVGPN